MAVQQPRDPVGVRVVRIAELTHRPPHHRMLREPARLGNIDAVLASAIPQTRRLLDWCPRGDQARWPTVALRTDL